MLPNLKEDLYFFNLVKDKVLKITKDGKIYDNERKKYLNTNAKSLGYRRLSYKNHGIQVHRLVWMTFNNKLIPEGLQVNHKNGIKYDNHKDNLELVTNRQNSQHAYDTGLSKVSDKAKQASSSRLLGENNINAKLTDKEVSYIRQEFSKGKILLHQIRNKYALGRRAVENMLLGRSYKHIPYEVSCLKLKSTTRILDMKQAELIRAMYATGKYTQLVLSKKFNVSRSTIKDITTNRTHRKDK